MNQKKWTISSDSKIITLDEIAKKIGKTPNTARRWIKHREAGNPEYQDIFPYFRVANTWCSTEGLIEQWLESSFAKNGFNVEVSNDRKDEK